MIVPASGRIAIAFTDVEGSTERWERAPEAMRAALDRHDAIVRAVLARHDGVEVKTIGDAFLVVFADPARAIAWAREVQEKVAGADWSDIDGLRVRIGIHAGDPVRTNAGGRPDVLGPVVNKASRPSRQRTAARSCAATRRVRATVRGPISASTCCAGSKAGIGCGSSARSGFQHLGRSRCAPRTCPRGRTALSGATPSSRISPLGSRAVSG